MKIGEEVQFLEAAPRRPLRFASEPPLETRLESFRVHHDGRVALGAELVLLLSVAALRRVEEEAFFGLTPESRGPSLLPAWDERQPVEIQVHLRPAPLRARFPEDQAIEALTRRFMAELLDAGGPGPRVEDFEYHLVLQPVEGRTFSAGFQNRGFEEVGSWLVAR
jgi:hypothetical protein